MHMKTPLRGSFHRVTGAHQRKFFFNSKKYKMTDHTRTIFDLTPSAEFLNQGGVMLLVNFLQVEAQALVARGVLAEEKRRPGIGLEVVV